MCLGKPEKYANFPLKSLSCFHLTLGELGSSSFRTLNQEMRGNLAGLNKLFVLPIYPIESILELTGGSGSTDKRLLGILAIEPFSFLYLYFV